MVETIRAQGKVYIISLIIKYILLLGILGGSSLCFIEYANSSSTVSLTGCVIMGIVDILILGLLVLQTREIIKYKLKIYKDSVLIKANRDIFITRHKDTTISLKNICSMQYSLGVRYDLINYGYGVCSFIVINYSDGNTKFLNVLRFNRKQINYIMRRVKANAENISDSKVEILPEIIKEKTY